MSNEKIPRSSSVNSLKEMFESKLSLPLNQLSHQHSTDIEQHQTLPKQKSTEDIKKQGASKISSQIAAFETIGHKPAKPVDPFEQNPFENPFEDPGNELLSDTSTQGPETSTQHRSLDDSLPPPPPPKTPPVIIQPSPAFLTSSVTASSESIIAGNEIIPVPVIPPPLPERPPLPLRSASTTTLELPSSAPVSPVLGSNRSLALGKPQLAAQSVAKQVITPDWSLSNRRPPLLDDVQLTELPQRASVKAFALCKSRICTLQGNTLKIWRMPGGDCTRSVTFGEAKLISVVFAPSSIVEDEGTRIWVGFERGELVAVDVESGATVEQNARAHTAAVSHLVRQGAQVWTLDDNGSLLIWHEVGENGFVSLNTRPRFLRVAPKPVASCVAGDFLWLSYGRALEVYAPCSGSGNALVKKVDLASIAGPCTCFAYHSAARLVYSGHDDGKILVWDLETKQRCGNVIMSAGRVSSLAVCASRYLWVGLTTGRIFVYDVAAPNDQAIDSTHWTVSKQWDAHGSSSVAQLAVDPLSLIALGKLVVVSLAESGVVKFWDGLLIRDWEEKELRAQSTEFCVSHTLKVQICSWNIDASRPTDLDEAGHDSFLGSWLTLSSGSVPDIIVIGLQEIVNLESTTVNARSLLIKSSTKTSSKTSTENRAQLWQERLLRAVRDAYPMGDGSDGFKLLECRHMMGLFSAVFARQSLVGGSVYVMSGGSQSSIEIQPQIKEIAVSVVKTGLGGLHGNKGGIATRLVIDDTSFCFVNCHLAAHQNQVAARNHDISTILRDAYFAVPPGRIGDFSFINGGDGTMIADHSHVFWFGDLNYRLDMTREDVISLVHAKNYTELMRHDQLRKQLGTNATFVLRGFREAPTVFDPTFKYDTTPPFEYDTSEKRRVPSWCDRILWRGEIEQHTYKRHEVTISDHRPISATFTALCLAAIPAARDTIKRQITRRRSQYVESKIQRAKTDYLMENFVIPQLSLKGPLTSFNLDSYREMVEKTLQENSFQLATAKSKLYDKIH